MPTPFHSRLKYRPSAPLVLFVIFLLALWLAGGGSRADLLGQVLVRGVCWILLILTTLLSPRPDLGSSRPVMLFIAAAGLLAFLQLIPLPPATWQQLPGHALLSEAATASGQPQPWRPWSIVPGATVNALSSLVVPLTALVLLSGLRENERRWLPSIILAWITAATLTGLLQFSGAAFNNPLLNANPGEVVGIFANRNHFALLLAIGCAITPAWAFADPRQLRWRGPIASILCLLFVLSILATGSRVGLVLALGGVSMGLLVVWNQIRSILRRRPRWALPALTILTAGSAALLTTAVLTGRASSVDRLLATDISQDLRSRALPTTLSMIGDYFPMGGGLGGFDPLFRAHEPFAMLNPTYFNHAHNDFLEILIDAGLPGGLLLMAGLLWWGWASVHAWRGAGIQPKLGSALLLLILSASAFDYPARTPIIMAIIVLAGIWLSSFKAPAASALPGQG